LTKREERIACIPFVVMFVSFGYAVFLPLRLGTIWLYGGLVIYLLGMVFIVGAIRNFTTYPVDEVITGGLYRFTRNPMYLGLILLFIGMGVAAVSWFYLVLTSVLLVTLIAVMPSEERYSLYRFGDEYLKYMERTPRWIGIPKSIEAVEDES
jgi:protein-S-isoprenylcysteine O-methyltransferase Ste14